MIRLFLFSSIISCVRFNSTAATMALRSVDFEVFGRVQGVFFRKFTKEQADKLELRGWCKNTPEGTVLGHLEGPPNKVETMMTWLQTKGSPHSQIEKAEFRNSKEITGYSFNNFEIKRG